MKPAQNRSASFPGLLLAGAILFGMTVAPTASNAADLAEQQRLVDKATLTLEAFAADPGLKAALREWTPETRALFIVPQFIRGAFVFGGAGGSGLLLVRDEKTVNWGDPVFYTIGSASFGLQIGGDVSEIVLLVRTTKGPGQARAEGVDHRCGRRRGTFAVQIAKALGAEVTGVCSTTKTDLVRSIGADQAIDYTQEYFADASRQYDVILDTAGRRSLLRLRRVLTPRGTLVIVGGEGGGPWLGGFQRAIFWAPLLSLFVGQRLRGLITTERKADLQRLSELIEAGAITPVIDKTYPLSKVPEAIEYQHAGHARGKVVITV